MLIEKKYRYFTLYKLNNKDVEFGRVKISMKSAKPLDAAKKLLNSICEYEGLTKNNKLKCKAHFYIRETTKDSKKRIYGPYKGSFKKYDKPVIIKLDNGREIKHKMYAEVIKIKGEKKNIQVGGGMINNRNNYYQLDELKEGLVFIRRPLVLNEENDFTLYKPIDNGSNVLCKIISLNDKKMKYKVLDNNEDRVAFKVSLTRNQEDHSTVTNYRFGDSSINMYFVLQKPSVNNRININNSNN